MHVCAQCFPLAGLEYSPSVIVSLVNDLPRGYWSELDCITMLAPSTVHCGCITDHSFGRKEPNMLLIGVDYHPSFQTIAYFVEATGEYDEQELNHRPRNSIEA